ncbi:nucleotide disphospho-sugar-binding domain-containing protein [Streptomyces sp. NPDC017529]|uniref:nucleotide disphospho-sugar-binding domain-containing protein n=1 Tax=Streptomyces sp. NPDC017529 TaxID=3365000 RepID=UPI0037B383BF
MRVLVTTSHGAGHVFPPIALAHALRAAGHDVLFATPGDSCAQVARAGLHAFDSSPAADTEEIFGRLLAERRMSFDRFRTDSPAAVTLAAELFAKTSEATVERTAEVALAWRPDLVVYTELQGAGPLVAALLGVPAVEHTISCHHFRQISSRFGPWLAAAYRRYGLAGRPPVAATIDTRPPSIAAYDLGGWPMRALPYTTGAVLPPWLLERPARPRVAVTLGTLRPQLSGVGELRPVVRAAGAVDADFVVALGDADPAPLGRLPANVRAEGWLPLTALLESCAAMIHHGGNGTTLAGLGAGVRHLVLPGGADDFEVARVLRRRGVGMVSTPDAVDAGLLRCLLADEDMLAVAAEVRDETAALPSPAAIVQRLEKLAG